MTDQQTLRPSVGALAVAMVAILLFAPAVANGFAYDDVPIIVGDPRIAAFDLPGIFTRGWWQDAELALYRPLTTLSFALDWPLAPNSAAWFHFTNILLHAAASVMAFLLLTRMFSTGAAMVGGLLFAAHPVHVEAVANVVGRAELLSGLFFLAAGYVWTAPAERRGWVAPSMLLLCALLSKESAIMLPAALVLFDAATGEWRGGIASYVKRNAARFAALAVVVLAYLLLRVAVLGAMTPGRVDPALELATSPVSRVLTALQTWPHYVRLMFFPEELLADYGPRVLNPAASFNLANTVGLVILASLVLGGLLMLSRGNGRAAFVLLWFPLTLLPVSNLLLPIGVLLGERTLYIPSLAACAAAAAFAAHPVFAPASAARAGRALVATALVLFAVRVVTRIPVWTSTDAVMLALAEDRPESFRAHWHLARMARTAQDPAAAMAQYDTAVALWPHRQRLVMEAAGFAAEQRSTQRAFALASVAVRKWPGDLDAQRLFAGAALDAGDIAAARNAIREGLRLSPGDTLLRRMAAVVDSVSTRSGS